jgi:aminoglycoside phosphotransferase family enzyme/predicted kinase
MGDAPFRPQDLLRAESFSHPIVRLELRETHISWVVLTGVFAYKIKKPVRFDFIDASTVEKRRHLCEEEIRLNSRLAPDLYLDVLPIVRQERGLKVGGVGVAIEYAVRMKQFSADDELPALLRTNAVSRQEVNELGCLIAEFHTHAERQESSKDVMQTRPAKSVLSNIDELAAHRVMKQSIVIDDLVQWTQREANGLGERLKQRASAGKVRECHGDLHAGNIVRFDGRLVPFDCIEFNEELRWIDVCDDIAFLFMDFLSHGRQDFAFTFLNRYLEDTGDYEATRVLRFFAVYRALVRARVDQLALEQAPNDTTDRRARMGHRIKLARELTQGPTRALLIVMQGVSGSGKSWLSERLLAEGPAVRVRSDVERKRLARLADRPGEAYDIYSAEFTQRTYQRALDCAEHSLSAGYTTIVDATFLQRDHREPFFALAARLHIPHAIVACSAEYAVLAARIVERKRTHQDASDADLAVLRHQLDTFQPLTIAESPQVITARTDLADVVDTTLKAIWERIER